MVYDPVCIFVPKFLGPFFRGMVAVKGVAADTDAQSDSRTSVSVSVAASVWPPWLCVPSALFLVCFWVEEEPEPHLRKR